MQPGSPSVTSELNSEDNALADYACWHMGSGIGLMIAGTVSHHGGLYPFALIDECSAFELDSRRSHLTSGVEASR